MLRWFGMLLVGALLAGCGLVGGDGGDEGDGGERAAQLVATKPPKATPEPEPTPDAGRRLTLADAQDALPGLKDLSKRKWKLDKESSVTKYYDSTKAVYTPKSCGKVFSALDYAPGADAPVEAEVDYVVGKYFPMLGVRVRGFEEHQSTGRLTAARKLLPDCARVSLKDGSLTDKGTLRPLKLGKLGDAALGVRGTWDNDGAGYSFDRIVAVDGNNTVMVELDWSPYSGSPDTALLIRLVKLVLKRLAAGTPGL